MTKSAIKQAFRRLETADQTEVLGQLAAEFAKSPGEADRQDATVFQKRRREKSDAVPPVEVKTKLRAAR
ncbi:MAG: hypothetical protein J5J06_11755 [Phycisphaerae bacterium]|nr:hypothetical protein [Phycisphaerae bacterium]